MVKKTKTIFELNDFCYQYPGNNDFKLDKINFSVKEGEVIGVAGKTGSGKSTLLHCLSGFIPHFFRDGSYKGEIKFLNKSISNYTLTEISKKQGVVFQNPSIQLFGLQVKDAVAFGLENLNMPNSKMKKNVDQILKKLNISHLKNRQTLNLSGGEQQTAAIASMLAMKPKVILFDEVISALDPNGQRKIRQILSSLKKEGLTMIVVDTDFEWLSSVADRILIIKKGKLAYDGETKQIKLNNKLAEDAGVVRRPKNIFLSTSKTKYLGKLNSVNFGYDDKKVINKLSAKIPSNACLGLIGHNGSGKTTLAKLIAGIYQPKSGTIYINGKAISKLSCQEAVREVGYLYQEPSAMFMHSTVKEEANFSFEEIGIGHPVKLNQFQLENFRNASPYELSAGQQQKLGLACLLATDPKILILDEPTLGQSQKDRQKLTKMINNLKRRNKTIILISHDWHLISRTAEYVWVLKKGQLVKRGPTNKIMKDNNFFINLGLPLPWEDDRKENANV